MSIMVRLDLTIQVDLPEGDGDWEKNEQELTERATEAAVTALPQSVRIYIDGEEKEPAGVHIDVSDSDVTEVWSE